jgi:hypothetical protein
MHRCVRQLVDNIDSELAGLKKNQSLFNICVADI